MTPPHSTLPPSFLVELSKLANRADSEPEWPAASWDLLRQAGGLRWGISPEYGGDGLQGIELLDRYQAVAGACLTTCFILSQREGFCRRVRDSGKEALCRELLPPLARGERFATVGMSQLTTSRQHLQQPTLAVYQEADAFVLDGLIPWVTGATQAGHILVGGILEDDRQVLIAMPADLPGVSVAASLELMALEGSLTTEVRCDKVRVDRKWLVAGPAEKVLQAGRAGTGGLETSCLALGLARAALDHLLREADARPPLRPGAERLERKWQQTRRELERLANGDQPAEAAVALRGEANTLVLQATQAALTASKGTGFVRPHPAQRWARQALFFLVWSCPWPAAAATLAYLTSEGQECG